MKKTVAFLLVFVFTFGITAQGATYPGVKKDDRIDKKNKQVSILDKFTKASGKSKKELKIIWNEKKGIPTFVTGNLSEKPVQNETDALNFLNDNKALFNLEYGNFEIERVDSDKLGTKHYRYKLFVDGIPVYGTELIVHTDNNGNVYSINGQADQSIPTDIWNNKIKISASKAIKVAEAYLHLDSDKLDYTTNKVDATTNEVVKDNLAVKSNKVIYNSEPVSVPYLYNYKGQWQAVQLVTLQFMGPKPGNWKIFVNAETGNVIDSFNAIDNSAATGTGVGVNGQTRNLNLDYTNSKYSLTDLTKGASIYTYSMDNSTNDENLPGTLATDTDNNFNSAVQGAAVDAHYNIGLVYDFYKNNFNRNSFDNAGATIKSSVHYGSNYNNAYWNGVQMVYGDGDGSRFKALSAALDVVGHEFTHAVTEKTANLEYRSQSGALNESMSDVFGYLIEGDVSDWQMGEDCYTPNTPGDALRDLKNPTLYGQPDNMSAYVTKPETQAGDWGGVHTNSGITNKAFYLLASTINDNSKTSKIYYRALSTYLTATSQFDDARTALLQAATDLYGANGAEYTAIANAFTQVGIGGTVVGNDTYEPNNSTATAYGPITSDTVYNSYIYSSTDTDYYYFNTTAPGAIAVSLTNIPKDYDVYLLDSSGTTVAKSETGGTSNESIAYSSPAAGKYYVKVIGYSGAYSTAAAYTLKANYPTGTSANQWYYETKTADSPHNYANNYNNTYTYAKAGAQKVSVHFSRLETEAGYDFVNIKDKNNNVISKYDGTKSGFWAQVDGDTINVNLVTDASVTAYGYTIDQVGYYSDKQLSLDKPANIMKELLEPMSISNK
ncbi:MULTISPECIES: M4 family metallopeptidase [Clostridium]|uniref:M4 family metallopeptidase n=1 Tax=Clostridium TaxID=1485 RepID=UPI0013E9570C|nr:MULTISPECIES: M4 family metallopeptidase [Clostridium]MBW9158417.1 M4 family metallopeptidase [Clostridium tagluense]MBZ9634168.1 M4 family metallopeptidase [Clostridium sp. FP1]WLC66903.1 M4 family metallopeptidase [Clostridium tagluense]